LDILAFVFNH